jgi:anti-anti-sigma factor
MALSVTATMMADGAAVLVVRGEVDHANAGELREHIRQVLAARRPKLVRVDLALVTFVDSGAVSALVAGHRLAAAGGARLVVANASPFVSRQLEIAGVLDLLCAPVDRGLVG